MSEPLTQTIREGYRNWRNNLILGVPQITGIILSIIIFIAACFAAVVLLGIQQPLSDFGERPNLSALILPAMSLLIGFILALFVTAYFCAAGIGMSLKAIETGKTEIKDMLYYGNRNVMSIFISLFLLTIAGIVVLVVLFAPAWIAFSMKLWSLGIGLAIAGGIIYMVYLAFLAFIYTMAPVAMVAKNFGPVEGIKEGYEFAMKNKLRLFLFWGFYFFISQLFGFVFQCIIGPLNYVNMFLPIVYSILILGLLLIYMVVVYSTLVPIFYIYLTRIYLSANAGIKKTVSKQYEPLRSQAQSSKPRELYI